MQDFFNFTIVPVNKKLTVRNTELVSKKKWDNIFYDGMFLQDELANIRCIQPCMECFHSWFNIEFKDFSTNKIEDLVNNNYLTHEIINEKSIAFLNEFGNSICYKTVLGCVANYVQVRCTICNSNHLMVMGIDETQPSRYCGQLQGIWRLKI